VLKCIPPQTQTDIYKFLPTFYEEACNTEAGEVRELVEMVREFSEKIPDTMIKCLESNPEAKALSQKIGEVSTKKVIIYIKRHARRVK
jgi:hypothetical protein